MNDKEKSFSHYGNDWSSIVSNNHFFRSSTDSLGDNLGTDQDNDGTKNDSNPIRHEGVSNKR